jgi:hypothetical protein
MGFSLHAVEILDSSAAAGGTTPNGASSAGTSWSDRLIILKLTDVKSNASGSTTSVTIAISANLPPNYNVDVCPNSNCVPTVSGKTQTGFTVTLNGNGTGNVPANTTFDMLVVA